MHARGGKKLDSGKKRVDRSGAIKRERARAHLLRKRVEEESKREEDDDDEDYPQTGAMCIIMLKNVKCEGGEKDPRSRPPAYITC